MVACVGFIWSSDSVVSELDVLLERDVACARARRTREIQIHFVR